MNDFIEHVALSFAAFVAVGFITVFEAAYLFRDTTELAKRCKRVLIFSYVFGGAFGFAAYMVLWSGTVYGVYQIANREPNAVALFVLTIPFVQLGRLEVAAKGEAAKGFSLAGDKESYYTKGTRMIRSYLYRRLIEEMPKDKRLSSLIMLGLQAAYTPAETAREYDTWAEAEQEPRRAELLEYRRNKNDSKKLDDNFRKRILLQKIVTDDIQHAVYLAGRRSTIIVERQAFR